MEIKEVSSREYGNLLLSPFSVFDTSAFCELNADKIDELKYLIFNDGKNRFAIIAGIKEGVVKFPFSSSFSMLNNINQHNKIACYHEAVKSLDDWCKQKGYKKVIFSLPPHFYAPTDLTMLYNALWNQDYLIEDIEVNFEYYLKNFNKNYEMSIDPKARQKLRASLKNRLSFSKTDDVKTVYDVIRQNRVYRGFPLWMSLTDIEKTMPVVDIDFFLVHNADGKAIASAMIYHINSKALRVIYWGNTPDSENLRPMNFLSYQVFNYYKNSSYETIDIGHSTDDSVPNFGLCDFKQAIGCECSPKFVMTKILEK